MADNINIKATLDTKEFDSSLEGMKQEFTALEKQLSNSVLSPQDQKNVLARMGTLKSGIDDLNKSIDNISRTGFEQLVDLTTPLVGGFTAAASALSLMGVENEKLNEIVQKTQALTIGLIALRDVSNLRHLKGLVTLRIEKAKNFVIDKLTFQNTVKQTAADVVQTKTKGGLAIATGLVTKAQLLWNKAVMANPIMLIVAGIAALIAGIILLVRYFRNSTEAVKEHNVALDGTQFTNQELLEKYNSQYKALRQLDLEYKKITGSVSDFGAEIAQLNYDLEDHINQIENDYINALNELNEKYSGFWRSLWVGIKKAVLGNVAVMTQEAMKYAKDFEEIEKEKNEEIQKIQAQHNRRVLNSFTREQQRLNDLTRSFNEQRVRYLREQQLREINELSGFLNKRLEAFSKNAENIEKIITDSSSRLSNLEFELELLLINDEVEKEIRKLEIEQKKYTDEIEEGKQQLEGLKKDNQELLVVLEKQNDEQTKLIQNLKDQKNPYVELKQEAQARLDVLNQSLIESDQRIETQRKRLRTLIGVEMANNNDRINSIKDLTQRELARVEFANEFYNVTGQNLNQFDEMLTSQDDFLAAQSFLIDKGRIQIADRQLISEILKENRDLAREQITTSQEVVEISKNEIALSNENNKLIAEYNETQEKLKKAQEENIRLQSVSNETLDEVKEKEDEINELLIQRLRLQQQVNKALQQSDIQLQASTARLQGLISLNDTYRGNELKAIKSIKQQEEEKFNVQQEKLNEYYQLRVSLAEDPVEKDLLLSQWDQALTDLEGMFEGRWDQIKANIRDSIIDLVDIVGQGILEVFSRDLNMKFDSLNRQLDMTTKSAMDSLDKLREADLISEEEYQKRVLDTQEDASKKELDLKIKQAQAEKRMAMFTILLDTIIGVAKSWGQGGGLFGAPLAAIVAAQGAIQLGLAASAPLPTYEWGGKIKGKPHKLGGTEIEAEAGEYMIRRDVVRQPGMEQLLEWMNKTPSNENVIKSIVDETVRGIVSIPVINVEHESTKIQKKVKTMETNSKW